MVTGAFLLAAVMLATPGDPAKGANKPQHDPLVPPATETAAPAPAATPVAAAPAPQDPLAAAPRISVADAHKALAEGKAILIDVRPGMAFDEEHAKGAISIPGNELYARTAELPKDKQIITYCT
jgi:hypothetical protein